METDKKLNDIGYKIYSLFRSTINYDMAKERGFRPCQKNFSCKIFSGHCAESHTVGIVQTATQWAVNVNSSVRNSTDLGFDSQRRKEFALSIPRPIQLWDRYSLLSVEKISYSRWNQKNRKVTTHLYISQYMNPCIMASAKILLVIMLTYREKIISQSSRYCIWGKCWLELVKIFSSL